MIDTLFGQPTYVGLKRRIAKKYFNRYWMHHLKRKEWKTYRDHLKYFRHTKVGDLVHTCTGLNGVIEVIGPCYIQVLNGAVLVDIDLETSVTCCSFVHCGVAPPHTKAQIEATLREMQLHPQAKEWGWDERFSLDRIQISDDGVVTFKYPYVHKK